MLVAGAVGVIIALIIILINEHQTQLYLERELDRSERNLAQEKDRVDCMAEIIEDQRKQLAALEEKP